MRCTGAHGVTEQTGAGEGKTGAAGDCRSGRECSHARNTCQEGDLQNSRDSLQKTAKAPARERDRPVREHPLRVLAGRLSFLQCTSVVQSSAVQKQENKMTLNCIFSVLCPPLHAGLFPKALPRSLQAAGVIKKILPAGSPKQETRRTGRHPFFSQASLPWFGKSVFLFSVLASEQKTSLCGGTPERAFPGSVVQRVPGRVPYPQQGL